MPDLDVAELARSLEESAAQLGKTTANLERHIAAEAQKRAAKLAVEYAKAAKEQVDAAKAETQRWHGCNAELRRQMKVLECRSAAYLTLEKFLKDIIHAAGGADVPAGTLMDALAASSAAGDAEYKRPEKQHAADG
jgi:hypothetical protein